MARDLFKRYFWLVDLIKRHGSITKQDIDRSWALSPFSKNGEALCRRTFYNYRSDIEDIFNIRIECNPSTYEYYIAEASEAQDSVSNWLLNSAAVSDVLSDCRDVSDRIFLEDVPSAREHLPTLIEALKLSRRVRFNYTNFTRSRPTRDIVLEPLFLKIFKQRWYVIGMNVAESRLKTYALDRMSDMVITGETFHRDESFNPSEYFKDAFGIVVSQAEAKDIVLKVDRHQAKYFRALPLHHSQQEYLHDRYSVFTYHMGITEDLVADLLSYGANVTVLQPQELRVRIVDELNKSLKSYKESAE
jgi:predicted DNA-binding transcriptional regulator YafY